MPKPTISEAQLQSAITQLLELDGWRCLRTDPVSDRQRGKGFGEVGMADCLYVRYGFYTHPSVPEDKAAAEVLWIEHKRKGGRVSEVQRRWHAIERSRGALTWIAGEDFEPSQEGFLQRYAASGLMRNNIDGLKGLFGFRCENGLRRG